MGVVVLGMFSLCCLCPPPPGGGHLLPTGLSVCLFLSIEEEVVEDFLSF